jgi:hypothetical protein
MTSKYGDLSKLSKALNAVMTKLEPVPHLLESFADLDEFEIERKQVAIPYMALHGYLENHLRLLPKNKYPFEVENGHDLLVTPLKVGKWVIEIIPFDSGKSCNLHVKCYECKKPTPFKVVEFKTTADDFVMTSKSYPAKRTVLNIKELDNNVKEILDSIKYRVSTLCQTPTHNLRHTDLAIVVKTL